jgi:wobble nucleotide-excising tRNase
MSFLKDKLKSAEEFGQLKQKVDNLEQQSKLNESRFEKIEEKLDDIKVTLARIDTSVKNLTKD